MIGVGCAVAITMMAGLAVDTGTTLECMEPHPALGGTYNGDTNVATVVSDIDYIHGKEILAHELVHAFDLAHGTAYNGYPSYFSEVNTGFDAEEYARMVTYITGWWPEWEEYPDAIPTTEEINAMEAAGWLPDLEKWNRDNYESRHDTTDVATTAAPAARKIKHNNRSGFARRFSNAGRRYFGSRSVIA